MSDMSLMLNDPTPLDMKVMEFNTDSAVMRAQQETRGAMMLAKQFPRNEDSAIMALMRSCRRGSFAERAEYSYPRGNKKDEATGKWVPNIVMGASVHLMREAARCWGNIQTGTEIVRDTDDERHIRSFAWDMESNRRTTAESTFRKLIQRKKKDAKGKYVDPPQTEWVRPDERDLRELTNKQASIDVRNCISQIIPYDVIEDAKLLARETKQKDITGDPDAAKKRILSGFDSLNITVVHLESYLGHKVAECSPKELADLRAIWTSIADGNSTWTEHMAAKLEAMAEESITAAQTVEYYNTFKASGWTVAQSTEWLDREFKIRDARKMPPDGFERAMVFARTKATKDIPPSAATTATATPTAEVKATTTAAPAKASKGTAAPVETKKGDAAAITLDESDPVEKKILQLFDIIPVPEEERQPMLQLYVGRWIEMLAGLESQLPQD